jgi:hypothetical protein
MGDSSLDTNCTSIEQDEQSSAPRSAQTDDQSSVEITSSAADIDCSAPSSGPGVIIMSVDGGGAQTEPSQTDQSQFDPSLLDLPISDLAQIDADEAPYTPLAEVEISEELVRRLDHEFEGKTFGIYDFGQEFKQALLKQIASVKRVLETEATATGNGATMFSVEQIDNLIEVCDRTGSADKTSPYVQQLLIAIVQEDIGRAYLRGLQARGKMLGISYKQLTAPLPEPTVIAEVSTEATYPNS